MALIIDGRRIADDIQSKIVEKVEEYKYMIKRSPGIAVVLVGENSASQVYVGMKEKTAIAMGMHSLIHRMPADTTEGQLLEMIDELNADNDIHGILVQLPLPKHIDEMKVIMRISPAKDVDGFHPINVGLLSLGEDGFVPCTPLGVMKLLERSGIDPAGKNAVVIGRSNIVGKPMGLLLLNAHATVTICHSKTANIKEICRGADILVAAVGRPRMVNREYVKAGAVVIDVGINRVDGKLCGDVDFDDVVDIVSAITPVPKGVGPMTIAMLMQNTLTAFERVHKL